ncbi:expressed protein [Batrachochytrium dendrobatidis JAM81]|uniref:Expressed protein n=1 Tax=Batrachochytrium dendrobatidis (strain JAM81 / FGSC 10211) TaxID=684364 RepID=F4P083_BATDJ|nr:uncharacterized protein BATDEDRAFT_36783 [Batrachochytrium dendrobatidis JAM81]EGF81096.1 expressed protein [Batrachochytrium dendrobatidis JAM81]|eukprot:XP_006678045.1 expressed protein [Batrachochytrium dendrobatidis JAM81]
MFREHSDSIKQAAVAAFRKREFSVRKTAQLFQIGVQTLYRWNAEALALEQDQHQTQQAQQAQQAAAARLKEGRCPILNQQEQQVVAQVVQQTGRVDTSQIVAAVQETRAIDAPAIQISRRTVYRYLRKNNITYKKAHFRIKKTDPSKLAAFWQQMRLMDAEQQAKNIISFNESSFGTHMTPTYGWSKFQQQEINNSGL